MNLKLSRKAGAFLTAVALSNTLVAFDVTNGFNEASLKGGDPMAHSYTGKFIENSLKGSAAIAGVIGVSTMYLAINALAVINYPGLVIGEKISNVQKREIYSAPRNE